MGVGEGGGGSRGKGKGGGLGVLTAGPGVSLLGLLEAPPSAKSYPISPGCFGKQMDAREDETATL